MSSIKTEKWHEVKEIFIAALQLAPAERERFLDVTCKDDEELRREIESLLSSSESAGSFMQNAAVYEIEDGTTGKKERFNASQNLNHYKILKRLGEGGMGEIYLAEDTKLDRRVAIKILNERFEKDQSNLQRFIREAKAASGLNHPNILTIFEIAESNETHFIVSEYIEGKTLREIFKEKSLKLSEILDIAIQIANALSAAHAARIIHRDIKPENIMVRPDGFAKILDFGLAKLIEQKNKSLIGLEDETAKQNETAKGVILGTVQYMSPEQAKGERVDQRTDIFSFGALIYEMLTGRTPFRGGSMSETLANLINKEPLPVSHFAANVPNEFERIVLKMLRKNKDERYQTIKGLLADLKLLKENPAFNEKTDFLQSPSDNSTQVLQVATGDVNKQTAETQNSFWQKIRQKPFAVAAVLALLISAIGFGYWYFINPSASTKQIESIAVLPFQNDGDSTDTEYLSDGMTETLIGSLSQLPHLSVKARSSVFRYKGKDVSPQTVGNELSVQAVLLGRVTSRGDQLTLSLELVDVRTENVIWSERYDRRQTELINLQSEIARDVSNKLQTRLSGADEQRVARVYTADPGAYQLYLQGLYHWNKRTLQDLRKSITLFQQAIDKDPAYAKAYAGLGMGYAVLYGYSQKLTKQEQNELYLKRRIAALQARELDDSLPEVHALLGTIYDDEWNFAAAENEYKRAIELDPNFASAHQFYAFHLSLRGRREEAFAAISKARELDPFSRSIAFSVGGALAGARRFDEAIAQFKKVLEMEPDHPLTHLFLAQVYEAKEMYPKAIAEFQTAGILLEKESPETAQGKATALMQALKTGGSEGYWQKRLEFSQKEYAKGVGSAYKIAVNYARLGDRDRTLEQLEKSFAAREVDLSLIKTESAFDAISSDERFQDLLRRIGLQS